MYRGLSRSKSRTRHLICAKAVVSEERGSWRWQDAYRVATYGIRRARDGRLLWQSLSHGPKLSEPQIRARNIAYDTHGSVHNRPVTGELLRASYARVQKVLGERFPHWADCVRRFVPGAARLLDELTDTHPEARRV